jgi:hypothetical protein
MEACSVSKRWHTESTVRCARWEEEHGREEGEIGRGGENATLAKLIVEHVEVKLSGRVPTTNIRDMMWYSKEMEGI